MALTASVSPRAPPHPRGSTRLHRQRERRARGSPAPAGIDPRRPGWRSSSGRLPRTRGDRPLSATPSSPRSRAPPHPRGSTLIADGGVPPTRGSPAPAGIDPRDRGRSGTFARLPRTRGDRPCASRCARVSPAAPPHPRGSTPRTVRQLALAHGSPAPAGIDRLPAHGRRLPGGLPRTRGDRPVKSSVP